MRLGCSLAIIAAHSACSSTPPGEWLYRSERCGLSHVALDGDSLYWACYDAPGTSASSGTITRVPTDGSQPEVLTSDALPFDIAITSGNLYWTNDPHGERNASGIWTMPTSGATPRSLGLGDSPRRLVVDANYAYWEDGSVDRGSLAGGNFAMLTPPDNTYVAFDDGIAVDDSNVYWVNAFGGSLGIGGVYSVPIDGGSATMLQDIPDQAEGIGSYPHAIAVDDNAIYWVADDEVVRMDKADHSTISLSTGAPDSWAPTSNGVAQDELYVYWISGGGSIRKVPKAGGATVVLATDDCYSTEDDTDCTNGAIAVDSTWLYFTTYWGIRKLGK